MKIVRARSSLYVLRTQALANPGQPFDKIDDVNKDTAVFSASATVRVSGFDSARDGVRVTEYLGQALGEALSAAVQSAKAAQASPIGAGEG